jgi:hypothetical protein
MNLSRLIVALSAVAALALPASALAGHENDPGTPNMQKLGHNLEVPVSGGAIHSDIAFWRNYAFEGSYDGFRILDIADPNNPVEVSDTLCGASQGDVTISPDGNVLVRSQDSARVLPGNDLAQACHPGLSGSTQNGFEGLQIFDVSNKAAPRFVKAVFTDFGSHTHTQYYDRANNRLIIYVSRSGSTTAYGPGQPYGGQNWSATTGCITAVEVPLANPAGASVVNRCIPAGLNGCHDVGVYEGKDRMYGACRPFMILWDISDPVNPTQLHAVTHPSVSMPTSRSGWHSASFSWNGEILIAGWEPGGGIFARCQATGAPLTDTSDPNDVQTDEMKSVFFFRASDGALINRWVLPRPQTAEEACTIHNYNPVPILGRHLLAMGNYTAGTSVLDFTDVMNPRELGYVDPLPVDINKGGAWSSHWYNRYLWESDIDEGLNVFRLNEPVTDRTLTMPLLNPQTQGEAFECAGVVRSPRLFAGRRATLTVRLTVDAGHVGTMIRQPAQNVRVRTSGAGTKGRAARTDATGAAQIVVRPLRAGTLNVVAPGELNMEGCAAQLRVQPRPRTDTAGGGAGLTGRIG